MYLDRQKLIEEVRLRDFVKRAIKVRAKNKVKPQIWEEFEIRSIVRKLLKEAPAEKAQHRSTGINVLEDLLKKIIPVIETDYKMLTTMLLLISKISQNQKRKKVIFKILLTKTGQELILLLLHSIKLKHKLQMPTLF